MFSHYATRIISPICKIPTFSEDRSCLNPRSHLKVDLVRSSHREMFFKEVALELPSISFKSIFEMVLSPTKVFSTIGSEKFLIKNLTMIA